MIIVTEQFYLEGTGTARKDYEYPKAVDFRVDGNGALLVLADPPITITPSELNEIPDRKVIAHYPKDSYFKVTVK